MTDPRTFQALAVRSGLRLYAKTGIKPNTQWTPTNMLRTASQFTGHVYRRGEYLKAADDLLAWVEAHCAAQQNV